MFSLFFLNRMGIWSNTDKRIDLHNQRFQIGQETYQRAHNKFSDMTTEEKRAFLGANAKGGQGRALFHMVKPKDPKTTTSKRPTTKKTTKTTKGLKTTITTRKTTTTTRQTTTTTQAANNITNGIDWRAVPGIYIYIYIKIFS